MKAILDVFQTMLVRRKIDLKSLDAGEPRLSGKLWKITATITQGISSDDARKVAKLIRDEGPKGIRTQVQGEELRVFSKKRDDLQTVQKLVREADLDFAVPVSYTHLDVYKRQVPGCSGGGQRLHE